MWSARISEHYPKLVATPEDTSLAEMRHANVSGQGGELAAGGKHEPWAGVGRLIL